MADFKHEKKGFGLNKEQNKEQNKGKSAGNVDHGLTEKKGSSGENWKKGENFKKEHLKKSSEKEDAEYE